MIRGPLANLSRPARCALLAVALAVLLCAAAVTAQAQTKTALLVVNSTTLTTDDAAIRTRLQNLGFTVTVVGALASTTADATGKTLVYISSTITAADVNTKFRTVAVPVVTSESILYDDMGMTGPTDSTDFGTLATQTQVSILAPTHALAAGLSGTVTVTTTAQEMAWGIPNANAVKIAALTSDSTKIVIFGYLSGAVMPGLTAPARRVGFFLRDTSASVLTTAGGQLFDAAVTWAAQTPPAAPTGFTATASGAQLNLSWTAVTGAGVVTYNIKRSTTSGSGYANIATGVTTTTYADTTVTIGVTYYYEVSATNSGGESANSTQASGVAPGSSISGTVFEDKNYGGGAGRSLASSSGAAVPGARVELYTGANYTTFATTDASGNYSFTGLAAATYTVRVVNGTVNSSRTGTEVLPPVQTYRTNASSGAAVAVTDHVGGEVPASVDAGNGSTTLTALTVGAVTPQSITSVVLGASNITGLQFGYSYNVIVNKNNTGQGSLRQFLLNANALANTGLAQSGLTAGIDNAVFMLADGTARPGLTASYATQFSSGIASVVLTSTLPTISEAVKLDASLQPGYVSTPMIELNGTSAGAGASGLVITAGSSTVRGLIVNRFASLGIQVTTNGGNTITGNYIGTNAAGTSGISNAAMGIYLNGATSNNTIGGTDAGARNVISGNSIGVYITGASATGNTVQGNFIGTNAAGSGAVANISYGVLIDSGATSNTVGGTAPGAFNVISGNANGVVILNTGTNNNTVLGNYIGTNSTGTAAVANTTYGIRIGGGAATNTVGGTTAAARNIISGNTQDGVHIEGATTTGNIVQGNYIGANVAGTGAIANGVGVNILTSSDNNTIGGTAAGAGNLIYGNGAQGVVVDAGSTGNAIRSNSIYADTGIGIDLLAVAAANDGTKTGTLANSGMDSAVFTNASLAGTTLTLNGYVGSAADQTVFAGATVDIFKSDNDASGFGEGQTYLGTITTNASGNIVNGTLTVSGLVAGNKITGTATDAANNTSEFGANFTVVGAAYSISGTVFEDKNYGGGAGRSLASSSGVARASARVELFDSGGTYQTFATTDGSGVYAFGSLAAGTYTVRVVNGSVTTSRGVLLTTTPTQTFRTNASSGAAVAVTDHVGGETPGLVDAVDGSTTLAALTTGITTPQSITSVALSSGNIGGVDFGYSFSVIVNKNNQSQGSLRRVLVYANAMSNTGLAQSGLTAGIDNAVFMLADGTARPGLTASYPSQFVSGVATVNLTTALATISDPIVLDATLQPGYAGAPLIELNGAGAGAGVTGLTITAGGSTVRGLIINRFTVDGLSLSTAGNNTVAGNYVGTNAAGTAAAANTNAGIKVSSSGNTIGGTAAAARNVISGNTSTGVTIDGGTGNSILGNYIGTNYNATGIVANASTGVQLLNGANNNTIGGATAAAGNVISGNGGKGIIVLDGTGNAVLSNSFYANAGIGIDLAGDGVTVNDGTKSGTLANSGMDTPVFTTTTLVGTTLTISGYVGSAPGQTTFASASVQVFKSDNDGSGYGEGQTYLGTLTADASGNFSGTLSASLTPGDKITGTATDGTNNTSEFAANATAANPPPVVALLYSVTPSGAQRPGTQLVYTVAFTNGGGQSARVFVVVNPLPAQTDFKLGSPSAALGTTGITVAVEFSNDNASTWSYTPVSGGGGAPAGYDRTVTHVRWRFTGNLSQTSPNNTGSISCTVRIR